jgi:hypothetical protein
LICSQIHREFPDDPIVAEENPKELLKPERSESLKQIVDYVKEDNKDADEKKVIQWIGYGNGRVGPRFWTLDPIGENLREKLPFSLKFSFRWYERLYSSRSVRDSPCFNR